MAYIEMATIEKVRKLEEKIGRPILNKLIELFLTNTPDALTNTRLCLKQGRYQEIGAIIHSLKSSSAHLGADEMAAICQKAENLIDSGNPLILSEEMTSLLDELETAYLFSSEELKKIS